MEPAILPPGPGHIPCSPSPGHGSRFQPHPRGGCVLALGAALGEQAWSELPQRREGSCSRPGGLRGVGADPDVWALGCCGRGQRILSLGLLRGTNNPGRRHEGPRRGQDQSSAGGRAGRARGQTCPCLRQAQGASGAEEPPQPRGQHPPLRSAWQGPGRFHLKHQLDASAGAGQCPSVRPSGRCPEVLGGAGRLRSRWGAVLRRGVRLSLGGGERPGGDPLVLSGGLSVHLHGQGVGVRMSSSHGVGFSVCIRRGAC